jgi:hypothetical protein
MSPARTHDSECHDKDACGDGLGDRDGRRNLQSVKTHRSPGLRHWTVYRFRSVPTKNACIESRPRLTTATLTETWRFWEIWRVVSHHPSRLVDHAVRSRLPSSTKNTSRSSR